MTSSVSIISLISAIISVGAIVIVFSIFRKVYQENYKKPWLYIGISALFLAVSELIRFFLYFYNITIINQVLTEVIMYMCLFIAITILTYGLFLEYLILKFYKGKFVKMKFVPVQEGSIGGDFDIDISKGNSYLAIKKEKDFMYNEFAKALGSGFEGFLITEDNPRDLRRKYNIQKTPIGWILQTDLKSNENFINYSLDENSDTIDPIQVNNIISYIDNFLEQSSLPFIMLDLNMILRSNSFYIVAELLRYSATKIQRFNGIFIVLINEDVINDSDLNDLKSFFKELK